MSLVCFWHKGLPFLVPLRGGNGGEATYPADTAGLDSLGVTKATMIAHLPS